jgi:hypothetical protein
LQRPCFLLLLLLLFTLYKNFSFSVLVKVDISHADMFL